MKRRTFIKNTAFIAGSTFLGAKILTSEVKAYPVELKHIPAPHLWGEEELNIAWLGHSTVLIKMFDKWVLTDPALFDRVGVYFLGQSIGPSRITPPALSPDRVPKPDLILLSHAHMDHMDLPTLKYFTEKYPGEIDAVTAYLTSDVISDLNWKTLTVLDWGESAKVSGIDIDALEVKHFGWRFPWEKDRSRGYMSDGRSFNAYTISYNKKTVLFGGDTTYTDKLNVLKGKSIDVAIMPIGAYNPWKRNHCTPEEALDMAHRIGAKRFVPVHCMTFRQGQEPFHEPIQRLLASASQFSPEIVIDNIGQTYTL